MLVTKSAEASARHILEAPSLAWALMPRATGDLTVPEILERLEQHRTSLSSGELVLLDCARMVWNGGGHTPVSALTRLDDSTLRRVLEAVIALRPGARVDPAEILEDAA